MKKLTLILALMCMPVMAEEPASCELQGKTVEALMTARQAGLPISAFMEDASMDNLKSLVIQVYKIDVEPTAARKQAVINKSRDETMMYCYEHKGE